MAKQIKYYIVSITDVDEVLIFGMRPQGDFQDELKEEKRVKEELRMFQDLLERNLHERIKYIGEEKTYGKYLERYLFDHGGFLEIMPEQPLLIKAHFLHKHKAEKFAKAIKKAFLEVIPESKVKDMFINNVKVEEYKKDPMPVEKWAKMHHIYAQKSVVFTFIAVIIVGIFEIIKAVAEFISLTLFHMHESISITIISAVIVAFMFEPIKKKTEKFVDKYLFK